MDSITRELIFRNDMNEIAQDYFQKGLNLYHDSLRSLPEFVEPFKKLISINSMFRAQYKKALEAMTSTYLFSMDIGLEDDLNKRIVSEALKNVFKTRGISLSDKITKEKEAKWRITDEKKKNTYFIRKEAEKLKIYTSAIIPLRNFSPQGTFEVLDKSNYNTIAVWLDHSKNLMKIKDDKGNEISLIRFSNLSNIEIAYLEAQVSQEGFLQRLSPFGSNTAEHILNAYIPVSPLSREWSEILKEVQGALIKIMAYAHISPVPTHDQLDEKRVDIFEELSVVERVEVNFQDIQQEFLDEVGLERSSISVRKV